MSMDKLHKATLQENWTFLMENLTLEYGVLDLLISNRTISLNMMEEINAKPLRRDQNSHFLSTLMRRGPNAYDAFLAALKDNCAGQAHIAAQLEETYSRLVNAPQSMEI